MGLTLQSRLDSQRIECIFGHLLNRIGALDHVQKAELFIKILERFGLFVVNLQSVFDRIRVVILAYDQLMAALFTDALNLWRVVDQ